MPLLSGRLPLRRRRLENSWKQPPSENKKAHGRGSDSLALDRSEQARMSVTPPAHHRAVLRPAKAKESRTRPERNNAKSRKNAKKCPPRAPTRKPRPLRPFRSLLASNEGLSRRPRKAKPPVRGGFRSLSASSSPPFRSSRLRKGCASEAGKRPKAKAKIKARAGSEAPSNGEALPAFLTSLAFPAS